jgi:flagellar biosynthesis/type III secretory pathway M-ring protein FliF/YscJ
MTHDKAADPDDDKLAPTITQQIKLAQTRAKNSIGAKTEDQINVDWFDDTISMKQVDVAQAGIATGSITTLVSQYGKTLGLLLVAAVFLGPMLMMIRRAAPGTGGGEVDAGLFFGGSGGSGGSGGAKGKRKSTDGGQFDTADDVFGEANEGEAVLTGIELDDETLQSRKMVDEVSTMIKENPDNAASLVKRWMSKGK